MNRCPDSSRPPTTWPRSKSSRVVRQLAPPTTTTKPTRSLYTRAEQSDYSTRIKRDSGTRSALAIFSSSGSAKGQRSFVAPRHPLEQVRYLTVERRAQSVHEPHVHALHVPPGQPIRSCLGDLGGLRQGVDRHPAFFQELTNPQLHHAPKVSVPPNIGDTTTSR